MCCLKCRLCLHVSLPQIWGFRIPNVVYDCLLLRRSYFAMASVTLLRHASKASLNDRDVISFLMAVNSKSAGKTLRAWGKRGKETYITYIFSTFINFSWKFRQWERGSSWSELDGKIGATEVYKKSSSLLTFCCAQTMASLLHQLVYWIGWFITFPDN